MGGTIKDQSAYEAEHGFPLDPYPGVQEQQEQLNEQMATDRTATGCALLVEEDGDGNEQIVQRPISADELRVRELARGLVEAATHHDRLGIEAAFKAGRHAAPTLTLTLTRETLTLTLTLR